jgi:hypothetical protein
MPISASCRISLELLSVEFLVHKVDSHNSKGCHFGRFYMSFDPNPFFSFNPEP